MSSHKQLSTYLEEPTTQLQGIWNPALLRILPSRDFCTSCLLHKPIFRGPQSLPKQHYVTKRFPFSENYLLQSSLQQKQAAKLPCPSNGFQGGKRGSRIWSSGAELVSVSVPDLLLTLGLLLSLHLPYFTSCTTLISDVVAQVKARSNPQIQEDSLHFPLALRKSSIK